jgi:hypothetical protein
MRAGCIAIGPFLVDAGGRLSPRDPDMIPGLGFRYRGRCVQARLQDDRLSLCTELGRVPSSAASNGDRRGPVFTALRALPAALPPAWRVRLLADHRVQLETEAALTAPTAAGLMTALTSFLLALSPYLDLLEETGVTPGSGGTAKACPG